MHGFFRIPFKKRRIHQRLFDQTGRLRRPSFLCFVLFPPSRSAFPRAVFFTIRFASGLYTKIQDKNRRLIDFSLKCHL